MIESKPLIVLLSGTYGVGKTTIAHHLGVELSIMQRVGLGSIIKTIKTVLPENEIVKEWNHYNLTDRGQVREKLRRESQLIGRIIATIVDSAQQSGENYLIEGVQLLPEFLPMSELRMFILGVSDTDAHRRRFEHPTITRARHLNNCTFELARLVESIILEEAQPYSIPVINNLSSPMETAALIKMLLLAPPSAVAPVLAASTGDAIFGRKEGKTLLVNTGSCSGDAIALDLPAHRDDSGA